MASLTLLLTASAASLFFQEARSAATCYHINGSLADSSHQPCNPDAEVSACCATNKKYPDLCLSSGLCMAQEPLFIGLVFSDGCTDESGLSDECPHFCPDRRDDSDDGSEVEAWNLLQCNPGGSFCCRGATDGDNCCDDSTAARTVDAGDLVVATLTNTEGEARKTVTVTETVSPTGDSPADNGQCSAAQDGQGEDLECPSTAVVGGAVGGSLGAAFLASLIVIAMMWKRLARANSRNQAAAYYSPDTAYDYKGNQQSQMYPAQELDSRPPVSELGSN